VSEVRLPGWSVAPRLGIVVPPEGAPGWTDAAWWAVQLEAWGYPAERLADPRDASDGSWTTLVAAAEALDSGRVASLAEALEAGTSLVLAGRPSEATARLLGLTPGSQEVGGRLYIDDEDLRVAAGACVPSPGVDGCVVLDPPGPVGELDPG